MCAKHEEAKKEDTYEVLEEKQGRGDILANDQVDQNWQKCQDPGQCQRELPPRAHSVLLIFTLFPGM